MARTNQAHKNKEARSAAGATGKNNECAGLVPLRNDNVTLAHDPVNNRLVISIGVDATHQAAAFPSASGKSRVLATTHGFISVPGVIDGLKLQITATLPKQEARSAARATGKDQEARSAARATGK